MAKRELIDRKQAVEVVSNGFDRWHMINLLASQESIPAITEQEIVEPYLNKIRAEIEQEYTKFRNRSDIWNERACGIGVALEIIDKYKAESEE